MITLKDIIGLTKELPEKYFEEVFENLKGIKEKAESEEKDSSKMRICPHCKSLSVVRNGKRNRRQSYICRDCAKAFVQSTGSAIANSHSGENVWKEVIRDTVAGISLDKTANSLDLHHSTVFNMRHKILTRVEDIIFSSPITLNGVCELDETYVLESVKGRKIPSNYHRKPRRHGSKASKSGLSNEQVCICAGVNGDGKNMAYTINRASPSKVEIEQVFGNKITDDTVILCDGNKNYDVLDSKCTVAHIKNPNKINGLHSFIKERLRAARGVATIYQNRYNALLAMIYNDYEAAVDKIYKLMTSYSDSFMSIKNVKSKNLCHV